MASLFTLRADLVDGDALRVFLDQANPEATVLEYKRALNDHVLKTIAAMANTLGGLVLVGVPERKGLRGLPDAPVGVQLADRDRLTSQCFAKLEPPFEPEIIPVRLDGTDLYVLVVRVDPARAHPPVVLDGTLYIRLGGQTQAADRYRMAAMFADRSPVASVVPALGRPRGGGGHPLFDPEDEALIIRTAVETSVPPRSGVLDGRVRAALREGVRESELDRWLTEQTSIVVERNERPHWVRDGYINQSTEAVRTAPVRAIDGAATVAGQAVIELAAGRTRAGWATLILDLGIRPISDQDTEEGELRYSFAFSELKTLIYQVLHAALDEIAPTVFPLLTGTPLWMPTQTTVALDTGTTPLTRYVAFPRWPRALNAEDRPGPFFETPPGLDVQDPAERADLINEWLAQLLYNQRFSDFEEQLQRL